MNLKRFATEPVSLSPGAALLVGVLSAAVAGLIAASADRADLRPDVDQLWFAARAVIDGRNPYELIGPGREFDYHWRLFYPLPAVLLFTPLASLPVLVSRITIASVGAGLLAYGISRHDARGLVVFGSRAFYVNAWYAQWTPLLVSMWYFPVLSALVAAKPTSGFVMLIGARPWRHLWRGFALAGMLTATAFVVHPTWVRDWLAAVDTNTHLRPWFSVPGGALLFLSVLRWRRWEAWFLAVFALVPQTFHPLATLPLILLPATLWGKVTVALLTYLPNWLLVREPFGSRLATATPEDLIGMYGVVVLWSVLIPTLFFVLRLPNRGRVPDSVERISERLPAWIRGNA